MSGLSLELSELTDALAKVKLNSAIQAATFGAWPLLIGLPVTTFLRNAIPSLLPSTLLDGILIMSCLPTTVNMCIFLTSAAGGNVATALSNAVISNLAGIFVTPALLLRFFGADIRLPFLKMMYKLCNKVLLPVAIGQVLRRTPMKEVYQRRSKLFKKAQEVSCVKRIRTGQVSCLYKSSMLVVGICVAISSVETNSLHVSTCSSFGYFSCFSSTTITTTTTI